MPSRPIFTTDSFSYRKWQVYWTGPESATVPIIQATVITQRTLPAFYRIMFASHAVVQAESFTNLRSVLEMLGLRVDEETTRHNVNWWVTFEPFPHWEGGAHDGAQDTP